MRFDFFSRKKFKCITCGEKFKTETELQGHRKIEHDMKGA
jgi:DNA-directed RNA polymerase subunit RPC12/RpoP